jgi:hypothetical protein
MNGPQIKAVLERAYRNYYYYKYVPGYGGYSYYTVGMLVPDAGSEIVYYDGYPDLPNGNNVVSLQIQGVPVNFNDTETYYNVSTLNYLAAGNCNFNDSGRSLWPPDQITADTQHYVRDAVIEYIQDEGTINPAIDGRLQFTAIPPTTTTTTIEPECALTIEKGLLPLRAGLFARLRRIVIKGTISEWDKTSQVTIEDINVIIQRVKNQETIIAWIIIPGKLIANFEPGTKEARVRTAGKEDCIGEIVIE